MFKAIEHETLGFCVADENDNVITDGFKDMAAAEHGAVRHQANADQRAAIAKSRSDEELAERTARQERHRLAREERALEEEERNAEMLAEKKARDGRAQAKAEADRVAYHKRMEEEEAEGLRAGYEHAQAESQAKQRAAVEAEARSQAEAAEARSRAEAAEKKAKDG